jgi:sugar lactone lactonase YvrE
MLAGKGLASAEVSQGWDLVNATALSKSLSFLVSGQDTLCTDLFFKPDGTTMYVIGQAGRAVYQYTLSTAWDVTTATYASKNFSVGGQETTPSALAFKSDGTAMYIIGTNQDRVYQYTLSTAWDVSTASYASLSFLVSGQEINPTGLFFKPDGTTMYVVGSTADTVFQYTLSTAWNVSTASYASKSFSVTAQETVPQGLFFKSDGTTMYVAGSNLDTTNQYTLSTAWDVSTAAFSAVAQSFTSVEPTPQGVFISSDGGTMFVVGSTAVTQFPITVPWLISSSYYRTNAYSPVPILTDIAGVSISTDGLNLYVLNDTNDTVVQYPISTAFDLLTTTASTKSFSVGAQDTVPADLFFKPDGTKMYILGGNNSSLSRRVYQYSLATAWDVSTSSYDSIFFSVAGQETVCRGMAFSPDGTRMYIIGVTNDTVFQYTLSTAWNISTASYASKSFSVAARETAPTGLFFKSDGTAMYVTGTSSNDILQYTLSTAWDVTTASFTSATLNITTSPTGLTFSPDGLYAYISDIGARNVTRVTFTTPWNAATGNFLLVGLPYYGSATVFTQEPASTDLFLSSDSTALYIMGTTNDTVFQYVLTTPGDMGTAFYTGKSFAVQTQDAAPNGLFFKPDGTAMYMLGQTNDRVYQYTLSTAWDVSTASYASLSFLLSGQETTPGGLFFKPDGTTMYVVGQAADTVFQYTLSTAWDVNTASYASKSFSVSAQDALPNALFFKSDGTAMYIAAATNDRVFQYNLSTAWDVSTASYASISVSVGMFETAPGGLCFNTAGTRMYIVGQTSDTVFQFNTE